MGNLVIEIELGYIGIIAEGEDTSLREVVAEEFFRPENGLLGPGTTSVAEESVDKDDAGSRSLER